MALDFPANPVNGQVYDNFYYDSSMGTWRALSVATTKQIPAGVISQFAGSTAPGGYLLCTGQSLATADYPDLFTAIEYTYGGSGSLFNIPNLQNRVPVARGSGTFATLGAVGGAETVTLTSAQLPAHSHPITDVAHNHSQNSHRHTAYAPLHDVNNAESQGYPYLNVHNAFRTTDRGQTYAVAAGAISAEAPYINTSYTGITGTGNNTGGGGSHNNLQPYIVLNYIIKT